MKRKLLILFMMLCMCILPAYAQPEVPEMPNNNCNYQNYETYSSPVLSYLTPQSAGYMLTHWNESDKQLLVVYYDDNYNMLSEKKIAVELPVFGGFYATDNAYYVVSGQENWEESKDVEVIRITKYDLNWNRLGSDSLYGANTVSPFAFGSLRMDYCAPYLAIRTCHQMYKSSKDGKNHQANVTILLDTDQMAITSSVTWVAFNTQGYVSHSFNQFVLIDDDHIVCVDHGDSYPRAANLFKFNTSVSSGKLTQSGVNGTYVYLMQFAGTSTSNYTFASIGGFVHSSSHYITAGNASDQSEFGNKTRNIWVVSADRTNIENTTTYWLTNMPEDGKNYLATPQLVSLPDDRELVLWSNIGKDYNTFDNENDLYYRFLDSTGKPVGDVHSEKGNLSDCQPVVKGNKVVWYVYEDNYVTFYEINLESGKLTKTVSRSIGWKDLESISFEKDEIVMTVNYTQEFPIRTIPDDPTDDRVLIRSLDENIIKYYSNYYISYYRADNVGDTIMQAITPSGKSAECKVKVIDQLESHDVENYPPSRMYVSQTVDIEVSVVPEEHMKYVTYESDDPSVISISDQGVARALKPGNASVIITCGSELLFKNSITVYGVDPESIQMKQDKMALAKGESKALEAIVAPSNADNTVAWSSSNSSVATVDENGNVTGMNAGTATITATAVNGLSATCEVTVNSYEVTGISLDKTSLKLQEGSSEKLVATITPANATDKTITWSSSKSSVASVDANGLVTAKSGGNATITATTSNGLTATCSVTVTAPEAVQILKQPESQIVAKGEKAVVSLEASGEGLAYQWYLRNKNAANFTKSSITKKTYSVTMSDAVNGRELYCVVTDQYGNSLATRTITLSQYVALEIVEQPYDVYEVDGDRARTNVVAQGSDLSYQWYVKNKTATKFSASSVKTATYSTTMSNKVDGRQAYCIVTDSNGNKVQTVTVTFRMIDLPSRFGLK